MKTSHVKIDPMIVFFSLVVILIGILALKGSEIIKGKDPSIPYWRYRPTESDKTKLEKYKRELHKMDIYKKQLNLCTDIFLKRKKRLSLADSGHCQRVAKIALEE